MKIEIITLMTALILLIEAIVRLSITRLEQRAPFPIKSFWLKLAAVLGLTLLSFLVRPRETLPIPLKGRSSPIISLNQTTSEDIGGYPQITINHTIGYDKNTGEVYGLFDGKMVGNGTALVSSVRYPIRDDIGGKWESIDIIPLNQKTDKLEKPVSLSLDGPVPAFGEGNVYIKIWTLGRVRTPTISVAYADNAIVVLHRRTWIGKRVFDAIF